MVAIVARCRKRPIGPLAERSRATPGRRAPRGASLCRTLAGVSSTLDDRVREAIASRLRRIGTIGLRTWPDTSSSNECRIAPPVSSRLPPSASGPTATVSIRRGGGGAESRQNGCGTWPPLPLWRRQGEAWRGRAGRGSARRAGDGEWRHGARASARSVARMPRDCPHTAGRRGILDRRDVRRDVRRAPGTQADAVQAPPRRTLALGPRAAALGTLEATRLGTTLLLMRAKSANRVRVGLGPHVRQQRLEDRGVDLARITPSGRPATAASCSSASRRYSHTSRSCR